MPHTCIKTLHQTKNTKPGGTNLDAKIRPSKITDGSIISISPTSTTLFLPLFHSKISKHSTLTQGLLLGSVHGPKFQVEFPSQNNRHHASPTTLPLRDTHRQTVRPTTQSTHPTATKQGLQHRRRRSQQKKTNGQNRPMEARSRTQAIEGKYQSIPLHSSR